MAVEEQFYLIWPFIILFPKKKYLIYWILFFIASGVIADFLIKDIKLGIVFTPTCFDAFGLGGLLAWFTICKPQYMRVFFKWLSIVAVAFVVLFTFDFAQNNTSSLYIPFVRIQLGKNIAIPVPVKTIISVIAMWVIAMIVRYHDSTKWAFRVIWNNKILMFTGKISYALYIFHSWLPFVLNLQFINVYLNPLLPDLLYKRYWSRLYTIENAILLFLSAWLSYIIIEKPFLRLKKYFTYTSA